MAMTRWQPFQELTTLRNVMDRLFEESFTRPTRYAEWMGVWTAMDVYEQADKYVVEMALPGVKPADVEVSVKGNTLTVSGRLPQIEEKDRNYLLRERAGGQFSRTVTLPAEVEADKAQATFEHGILRLELPKTPAYQPKRIAIKAAGQ